MAQRFIRSPRGVMRSISRSFRRLHLNSEAVQAFTALRKVPYHHSTTLSAQEEDQGALACERKPLSDFTVAGGQDLLMGHGHYAIEIGGANIFLKGVTGINNFHDSPLASKCRRPVSAVKPASFPTP